MWKNAGSEEPGVSESYLAWAVLWRLNDFAVRTPAGRQLGYFGFFRVVLPIEIVEDDPFCCHIELSLDPRSRVHVLDGLPRAELEKFKRRLSGHVLAAVRQSPSGCADCADEARMSAFMWDGHPCPGCRRPYCRNPKCLRRIGVEPDGAGQVICESCGTANDALVNPAQPRYLPLRD